MSYFIPNKFLWKFAKIEEDEEVPLSADWNNLVPSINTRRGDFISWLVTEILSQDDGRFVIISAVVLPRQRNVSGVRHFSTLTGTCLSVCQTAYRWNKTLHFYPVFTPPLRYLHFLSFEIIRRKHSFRTLLFILESLNACIVPYRTVYQN